MPIAVEGARVVLKSPTIFIRGVFIPIQALPLQLHIVSYLTPLTYVTGALREAMMVPSIQFAVDLGILLIWAVFLETVAVVVLNKKTQF
jgi:ABC-type multidrug transport system permease subunit